MIKYDPEEPSQNANSNLYESAEYSIPDALRASFGLVANHIPNTMSSLRYTAAHSSHIKKNTTPSLRRTQSSPFSSLPRRKPIQRSKSKPEVDNDESEDLYGDHLDDMGLVQALATDLTLRDVAQAMQYIHSHMFSNIPERGGMSSTRISEVLNFRKALPPLISVAHVQALLNSPTTVEREISELVQGGAIRKVVVPVRGNIGEGMILVRDLEKMIRDADLSEEIKERFIKLLKGHPAAMTFARSQMSNQDAKALMQAGFITSSTPSWTSSDVYSRPADGSRGTATSLKAVSKAASGSMAAVGGEGAVRGTGGGLPILRVGDFSLALPSTGPFLKLLTGARAHLVSLLTKTKYREATLDRLREKWDGGIAADDEKSESRRNRREFDGVLPGKTRKWKQFYGITFTWVLEECVGAGLVEVFETGSVGRGVRAL